MLAILAIVLPLAVSLLLLAIVLCVAVADGFSVRRAPRLKRRLERTLSRGVPAPLAIEAATEDHRRVLLRQPAIPSVAVRTTGQAPRELRGELLASRRGRHQLPGVASASLGPLGLASWHHPATAPAELSVYANLALARELALQLRTGRAAPDGRVRRGPLGLGTDFEAIREYSADDDIRQVNWRATARIGRPMSNQYRVEQDHDVVCLLDCGRLMTAPVGDGTLLDVAMDAVTAVAMVADALGDRCGAVAFDAEIRRELAPARLGGQRVVRELFDLQPAPTDSDFERAFLRVGGSRRGLVLVLSDLIDERAARPLLRAAPMLSRRHAVLVAAVRDPSLESAPAVDRERDPALALAAASVLRERNRAIAQIRRLGADVVLAAPDALAQSCVQAYLRAKRRMRL